MTTTANRLYLAAILSALVFTLTRLTGGFAFDIIFKALPAVLLAAILYLSLKGWMRYALIIALLASAAGDIFLDLDREGLFLFGLGSFLITQLIYALVFWSDRTYSFPRLVGSAVLVGLTAGLFSVFWKVLPGNLLIPVTIYFSLVAAMTIGALFSKVGKLLPLGAVLFYISDSLIGINTFLSPIDNSSFYIIATYMAAQLIIVRALVLYYETKN